GGRSFEDRVFARFDSIDARLDAVDARFDGVGSSIRILDERVQNLEARSYDTKPIWERALADILETKNEVSEMRRELVTTKKTLIRRMDLVLLTSAESRADLQDMKDRVEKLEPPPGEGENGYD